MPALSHVWQASLAYVTGAHAIKFGVHDRWGYAKDIRLNINGDLIGSVPENGLVRHHGTWWLEGQPGGVSEAGRPGGVADALLCHSFRDYQNRGRSQEPDARLPP